jgi:hypothetical protein
MGVKCVAGLGSDPLGSLGEYRGLKIMSRDQLAAELDRLGVP